MQTKTITYFASLMLLTSPIYAAMDKTPDTTKTPPAAEDAKEKPKDQNPLTDTSKPILVTQQANQKTTTFTIRLAANAATGFQWFLTGYDPEILKPLRNTYVSNKGKLIGAPGVSVWEFQLKPNAFNVPQVTHIQLEYRRPWETNFGSRQSLTVIIQPLPPKDDVKELANTPSK